MAAERRRIVYIKWRDACYHPDYHDVAEIGTPVELEEVGFLVKETSEAYTVSVEFHGEGEPARLCLVIPKVNVVDFRTADLERTFRAARKRTARTKPAKPSNSVTDPPAGEAIS